MKTVLLLAGQGKRISAAYGGIHKALIPLNGRPLLWHLLDNLSTAGLTELVAVVGYRGDDVLSAIAAHPGAFCVTPVRNADYAVSNNLMSLLCARGSLDGEAFLLANGDMVFDPRILNCLQNGEENAIAMDGNLQEPLRDSPRIRVQDGAITDLGRHIGREAASGYAIGLYRFGERLSERFFACAAPMAAERPQTGFHEPLRSLFSGERIVPCNVGSLGWMDVDEAGDVPRAEALLKTWEGTRHA